MALPDRISVFTEQGTTKTGLLKPAPMLSSLSQDVGLAQVTRKVEETSIQMVDEASGPFNPPTALDNGQM